MKRKILVVFIIIALMAILTVPVMALDDNKGDKNGNTDNKIDLDKCKNDNVCKTISDIQAQITALQKQIENIRLIPGPKGPKGDPGSCSCGVTLAEFNALKAKVAALEGNTNPPPTCDPGAACTVPGVFGICASGTTKCKNGVSSCTQTQKPQPEVCDNRDNNCDGYTDEGSNLCGSGQVCSGGQCIIKDICIPNPCTTPPGPTCSADNVGTTYGSGVCTSLGQGQFTCNYNPVTIECAAPGQICQDGQCKLSCAGIVNCIAISGCTFDPSCKENCIAQGSTVGSQDYNAFHTCQIFACPIFPPDPSCVLPDCNALYPSCSG